MSIRGWGFAGVAALVLGGTAEPALAAPAPTMVVSGQGGQSAVLTVGSRVLTVGYPFFDAPRIPGPDGSVGGVVIQRLRDGKLVGGLVLQNAPGFDTAVDVPLVDFDKTRLPAGRYRFTLLGTGPRSVQLQVLAGAAPRQLATTGPARPITRTVGSSAPVADRWTDDLGRLGASDYLLVGAGSGGEGQQADDTALCVQSTASAAGDPCIGGEGFGLSPGAGGSASWSGALYPPGDLRPGTYAFTGHAAGVGPSSVSGHAAVVISLRR